MTLVDDPEKAHIQITDDTGLDVVLNGERMSFRDGYEKVTAVEAEYGDGVLVVHVDWESGLSVEAAHLNEAETEELAVIPCVLEYKDDDGDRKQFLSPDERYAFELELVRIYPDEPEVATDGGQKTLAEDDLYWGQPFDARRYHIFDGNRSLCGSWMFSPPDDQVTDDDTYSEGQDCKACCRAAGVEVADDA